MSLLLFIGIGVYALDRLDVCGSRHEVNDSVEERLNTLVTVSCTAANRNHLVGNSSLTDNLLNFLNCRLNAFKIFLHEFIILLND